MATKVILDVDTGTDDAIALMIAALSPDLDLLGATTVVGNCPGIVVNEDEVTVSIDDFNTPIPDDGYDGTLDSMACASLEIVDNDDGINWVQDVTVELGLMHPWAGDLTIKVESPVGTVLTLMSRPNFAESADDGEGCCGTPTNFVPNFPVSFNDAFANNPEMMVGLDICKDDNKCEFYPNPDTGPGVAFSDFAGEPAIGTWRVCVGDSVNMDMGAFNSVALTVVKTSAVRADTPSIECLAWTPWVSASSESSCERACSSCLSKGVANSSESSLW